MAEQTLQELKKVRLNKLQKLENLGFNPFASKISLSGKLVKISSARSNNTGRHLVAGRIWSIRKHGGVIFMDLKDDSGIIQTLFQKKDLQKEFEILSLFDNGDFIAVAGEIITTDAGELTISVEKFQLLTKSIRPLPSTWFGLKDEEERYRQRYVDLLLNDDLRDMFKKKAIFWQSMRDFLIEKEFIEVETPVLENTAGGADANPFITHHNALDIDLYLRISMGELWQKRLMVAGFGKTFEIGRQFRNEGIDREHLQDYTQMEFYWGYANYEDSMKLVEEMYKYVAQKTFGTLKFHIGEHKLDLSGEWEKIDYREILLKETGIDISSATETELRKALEGRRQKYEKSDERGRLIDSLWKSVRKKITGPVFLTGHPVEVSPLAKRMETTSEFVERFQVIIAGSENGNGYSELNDPIDQAKRFSEQEKMREAGDAEAQMMDNDFVRALEYGMPPTSGFGVSERLFSFLADKSVRETVLFPLLRPEEQKPIVKNLSVAKDYKEYAIFPDVKSAFPGTSFAYIIIEGVNITKTNTKLEDLKQKLLESKKGLSTEDINKVSPIISYRNMLKKTGIDYHSRRPSPEALLRRIVLGKGLYTINTAVDAYNLAVIETGIGLGGFNYSKISPPVVLRFSDNGEKMHLLGDESPVTIKEGELVYSDKEKLLTLDLNYRDINETKITEKTKDIILFADGGPGIDREDVLKALKLGSDYIVQFCGGNIGEIKMVE